jgi:predicted nucleic acid-binding protein
MRFAYVDTSCLVAIAFDEPGARRLAVRLSRFGRLLSSNLLEAELRSALLREGLAGQGAELLTGITWVYPDRPLTREFDRITGAGYLRGADLWHLACALFLAPDGRDLAFLTLDRRQREVAERLGFATKDGPRARPGSA